MLATNEPQNIVKHQVRAMDKVRSYFEMPEIRNRFSDILGDSANQYVNSVLVAVANSENLQACSLKSIAISAMRAATLNLSVDKDLKQAHLVPYGNEAQLIVDYHGLVMLMENTGEYQIINVSEVYEGEEVKIDRWSGRVDITGEKKSDEIIGWCGYFKKINGYEKWLYMTNEQADAHGQKYSKAFNSKKSGWQTDRPAMRRKTVLRQLATKWGHFSPIARRVLFEEEAITAEVSENLPGDDDPRLPVDGRTDAEKREDAARGMAELFGGTVEEARATFKPAQVIDAEPEEPAEHIADAEPEEAEEITSAAPEQPEQKFRANGMDIVNGVAKALSIKTSDAAMRIMKHYKGNEEVTLAEVLAKVK